MIGGKKKVYIYSSVAMVALMGTLTPAFSVHAAEATKSSQLPPVEIHASTLDELKDAPKPASASALQEVVEQAAPIDTKVIPQSSQPADTSGQMNSNAVRQVEPVLPGLEGPAEGAVNSAPVEEQVPAVLPQEVTPMENVAVKKPVVAKKRKPAPKKRPVADRNYVWGEGKASPELVPTLDQLVENFEAWAGLGEEEDTKLVEEKPGVVDREYVWGEGNALMEERKRQALAEAQALVAKAEQELLKGDANKERLPIIVKKESEVEQSAVQKEPRTLASMLKGSFHRNKQAAEPRQVLESSEKEIDESAAEAAVPKKEDRGVLSWFNRERWFGAANEDDQKKPEDTVKAGSSAVKSAKEEANESGLPSALTKSGKEEFSVIEGNQDTKEEQVASSPEVKQQKPAPKKVRQKPAPVPALKPEHAPKESEVSALPKDAGVTEEVSVVQPLVPSAPVETVVPSASVPAPMPTNGKVVAQPTPVPPVVAKAPAAAPAESQTKPAAVANAPEKAPTFVEKEKSDLLKKQPPVEPKNALAGASVAVKDVVGQTKTAVETPKAPVAPVTAPLPSPSVQPSAKQPAQEEVLKILPKERADLAVPPVVNKEPVNQVVQAAGAAVSADVAKTANAANTVSKQAESVVAAVAGAPSTVASLVTPPVNAVPNVVPVAPVSSPADTLLVVEFKGGETTIPAEWQPRIQQIVNDIKDKKEVRLKIVSYAEGIENQVNSSRRISLQRAIAIRSEMIKFGLESIRINVQAMGKKEPTVAGSGDRADVLMVK